MPPLRHGATGSCRSSRPIRRRRKWGRDFREPGFTARPLAGTASQLQARVPDVCDLVGARGAQNGGGKCVWPGTVLYQVSYLSFDSSELSLEAFGKSGAPFQHEGT